MTKRKSPDLAVGDAAYVLGVSPKTVTRWCNEGKIVFYRTLGGHRRIPAIELDRIMDARRIVEN